MKEKLPWFKFFATDWISDPAVRTMSSRQKGWYIDLLAYAWQEDGLPNNTEALQALTSYFADLEGLDRGGPDNTSNIYNLREEFLKVVGMFNEKLPTKRITHTKLWRLRQEMEEVSATKTRAANKRWADTHASTAHKTRTTHASAHVSAHAMHAECEAEPEYKDADADACAAAGEQASSAVAAAQKLRMDRPKLAAAAQTAAPAASPELQNPTLAACALALNLVPPNHQQRRQCELALMEAHERISKAQAPRQYAERIVRDLLGRV